MPSRSLHSLVSVVMAHGDIRALSSVKMKEMVCRQGIQSLPFVQCRAMCNRQRARHHISITRPSACVPASQDAARVPRASPSTLPPTARNTEPRIIRLFDHPRQASLRQGGLQSRPHGVCSCGLHQLQAQLRLQRRGERPRAHLAGRIQADAARMCFVQVANITKPGVSLTFTCAKLKLGGPPVTTAAGQGYSHVDDGPVHNTCNRHSLVLVPSYQCYKLIHRDATSPTTAWQVMMKGHTMLQNSITPLHA